MAMQSSGATKHGVIQSSIALLQERFKQLQREKEMRERRQLLNNIMLSSSPSSSSSSGSEPETYNPTTSPATTSHDQFKLFFSDAPPAHHHLVSLSLWPGSESKVDGGIRGDLKKLQGAKEENYLGYSYGCLSSDVRCEDSHASDVDTSLHL